MWYVFAKQDVLAAKWHVSEMQLHHRHQRWWFNRNPKRVIVTRHGVKYIEMYLNTNTFEGFKYKYF